MARVTLAGVGSLVSEASARQSFPFTNFRLGEIRGWRRAFNQANWVNLANGGARLATGEVAALAMVPADSGFVSMVALMDVEEADLPSFYERETGYMIQRVPFVAFAADESAERGEALLCTACDSDAQAQSLWEPGGAMERHCAGSEYVAEWMRLSLRPLWPGLPTARQPLRPSLPDGFVATFDVAALQALPIERFPITATSSDAALYPAPGYLRGCLAAHRRAGLLDHFLDSTILADGQTSLREYLEGNKELKTYVEEERDGEDDF